MISCPLFFLLLFSYSGPAERCSKAVNEIQSRVKREEKRERSFCPLIPYFFLLEA